MGVIRWFRSWRSRAEEDDEEEEADELETLAEWDERTTAEAIAAAEEQQYAARVRWWQLRRRRAESAEDPWALVFADVVVLVGGVLTVGIGLVAVIWAPHWPLLLPDVSDAAVLAAAEADIRDAGLRIATGVAATTAGILAWGRLELSRREHRLARYADARAADAQELAVKAQAAIEDGQITERFTRAIEQLGHADVSVRLGALYALERVARDSDSVLDRNAVYDVICAYVRHHSIRRDARQQPERDADGLTVSVDGTSVDYRAAIEIALRPPGSWRLRRRDLSGAVISKMTLTAETHERAYITRPTDRRFWDIDLTGAHLSAVRFVGAMLDTVDLAGASLREVSFASGGPSMLFANDLRCELRKVSFERANLTGVEFHDQALQEVSFDGATLGGVSFRDAILEDVSFTSDVTDANLDNVDFTDAVTTGLDFTAARLTNCKFMMTDPHSLTRRCRMREARFNGATLRDVDFYGAVLEKVEFNCDWHGLDHQGEAILINVNFGSCTFVNVEISDARLTHVRLPHGFAPGDGFECREESEWSDGYWYSVEDEDGDEETAEPGEEEP